MAHKVVQFTVLEAVEEKGMLQQWDTGGKKAEQKPRVLLRGSLTSLEENWSYLYV